MSNVPSPCQSGYDDEVFGGSERLPESATSHYAQAGKSCWAAVTHTFLISSYLTRLSLVSLQKTTQTSPLSLFNMHEWNRTVFFKVVENTMAMEGKYRKCANYLDVLTQKVNFQITLRKSFGLWVLMEGVTCKSKK